MISKVRSAIKKDYRKIKFNNRQQQIFDETKKKYNYVETKPLSFAVKRGIDILGGAAGVVLTSPLVLLGGIALKLETSGPMFFKQKRIGKDGKPFTIIKLRTMYNNSERMNAARKVKDDNRITKVGKVLRKYSIDEFPQFINIIKGDMSLVGPRPLVMCEQEAAKDVPEFVERYIMKPGASLNYKDADVFDPHQRIAIEKKYIETWNLKNDFKTIGNILMRVFLGNNY